MPIPLRAVYDAARLRLAARESRDARQTRRLLALAAIYDGATRSEAASIGGVTVQIVRDWVVKLNTGGPETLVDYKGPSPQPILTDAHRTALAQALEDGPVPPIRGVVRWRVIDLVQWLSDTFHVSVSKQTLSRELRHMGYRRLSARPRHHAQATGAIEAFKKPPRASGRERARGGCRPRRRRSLVRRRGQGRPEEQDHPALGPALQQAVYATGPAHGLYLHLWRDLPGDRRHRRSRAALVQHRSDRPAPGRDQRTGDAGQALRIAGGSGWMARLGAADRAP